MLQAKKLTRASEGKKEALDALSEEDKGSAELRYSPKARCANSNCAPSSRRPP